MELEEWLNSLTCEHKPGWFDKAIYYAHIVWQHRPEIWGEGKEPDFVVRMCLTNDWIECGIPCPSCIKEFDKHLLDHGNYYEEF